MAYKTFAAIDVGSYELAMKVFEISYLLAEILDIYQYSFKQTVNNISHK